MFLTSRQFSKKEDVGLTFQVQSWGCRVGVFDFRGTITIFLKCDRERIPRVIVEEEIVTGLNKSIH